MRDVARDMRAASMGRQHQWGDHPTYRQIEAMPWTPSESGAGWGVAGVGGVGRWCGVRSFQTIALDARCLLLHHPGF